MSETDEELYQRLDAEHPCQRCAALESEVARLEQERNRASEPHAALMGGWLSRNGGAVLSDNPHPAGTMSGDWWEKGWQWRDDALASDSARALLRELAAEIRPILGMNTHDLGGILCGACGQHQQWLMEKAIRHVLLLLRRVEAEAGEENANG